MTLLDPTSGAGYGAGVRLPSADMTTIATQQPDAIDGVAGGAYSPTAPIEILGAQGVEVDTLTLNAGGTATLNGDLAGSATVSGTIAWAVSNLPALASREYTYTVPQCAPTLNVSARWATTNGANWVQSDVTSAGELWLPIPWLPNKGAITSVILRVDGDLGGNPHSGLPATMPAVSVRSVTVSTGAASSEGSTTDSSASVATYEAPHNIGVTGLTLPIDGTKAYFVRVTGETGANSVASALGICGIQIVVASTQVAPG